MRARGRGAGRAGGIHAPLYNHSTFGFHSTADLLDVVEGRKEGNLCTRYGLNPTIRSLERKPADLDNGEAAFAFSSGMAAEAATFLAHAQSGDHIVCIGDVYGGTYELLGTNLPGLGIETTFLLANEAANLTSVLTDRTKMVVFETPTNPTLDVIDIAAVARAAKAQGALTVVDRLRIFSIAASLSGVESLATQPITTTHHGMSVEERTKRGSLSISVQGGCAAG